MLPRTLLALSTRTEGERIVPHYLTEQDHPWLRAALDEYERFVGRRCRELTERFGEPLPVRAPRAKRRVVQHLLERLGGTRFEASVPPREARWVAFRTAARDRSGRTRALEDAAQVLGVGVSDVEAALFADLRSERRVGPLPGGLHPAELAAQANLAIVGSLLHKAVRVRIRASGDTRALVRHARRLGLICLIGALTEEEEGASDGVTLDISGPYALFRYTDLYGRQLASLVPRAASCHRFELVADCALGRGREMSQLIVRSGDPIAAGTELPPHESRLEERFERDLARRTRAWQIVREPSPIQAGGSMIYPDFELIHRRDPERRWLLEIAGFWTLEYLESKLGRLREANIDNLILCVDARRRCSDADLPPDAKIVRYRSRIDPAAVLEVIGS